MKRRKRMPMAAGVVFFLGGVIFILAGHAVGTGLLALGIIFVAVAVGTRPKT